MITHYLYEIHCKNLPSKNQAPNLFQSFLPLQLWIVHTIVLKAKSIGNIDKRCSIKNPESSIACLFGYSGFIDVIIWVCTHTPYTYACTLVPA